MSLYSHLQERSPTEKPVTVSTLAGMKAAGEPIACLTAYDASFAALVDDAGVDVVLVGDSLGMVVQGHDTTVPVTMEHMVYHTRCVSQGLSESPKAEFSVEPPIANSSRLFLPITIASAFRSRSTIVAS